MRAKLRRDLISLMKQMLARASLHSPVAKGVGTPSNYPGRQLENGSAGCLYGRFVRYAGDIPKRLRVRQHHCCLDRRTQSQAAPQFVCLSNVNRAIRCVCGLGNSSRHYHHDLEVTDCNYRLIMQGRDNPLRSPTRILDRFLSL